VTEIQALEAVKATALAARESADRRNMRVQALLRKQMAECNALQHEGLVLKVRCRVGRSMRPLRGERVTTTSAPPRAVQERAASSAVELSIATTLHAAQQRSAVVLSGLADEAAACHRGLEDTVRAIAGAVANTWSDAAGIEAKKVATVSAVRCMAGCTRAARAAHACCQQ